MFVQVAALLMFSLCGVIILIMLLTKKPLPFWELFGFKVNLNLFLLLKTRKFVFPFLHSAAL